MNVLMAVVSSRTLPKVRRWMAWRSMMANQTSTRFIHDADVEVKWTWTRGLAMSQPTDRDAFGRVKIQADDVAPTIWGSVGTTAVHDVVRRDMSVVGPRLPLPTEVELDDDEVRRRLLVRPGITGLWQVSARSDLPWRDSMRLDMSYVENWSMIGDLAISLATVPAVFRRSGAY